MGPRSYKKLESIFGKLSTFDLRAFSKQKASSDLFNHVIDSLRQLLEIEKNKTEKTQKIHKGKQGRKSVFRVSINGQEMDAFQFSEYLNIPKQNIYMFFANRQHFMSGQAILEALLKKEGLNINASFIHGFNKKQHGFSKKPSPENNSENEKNAKYYQKKDLQTLVDTIKAKMTTMPRGSLKAEYYRLMKIHHPDVGGNDFVAQQIIDHYAFLTKRSKYY
jgi:hypothetical protein